ncbi:MAG TPA: DUF1150 family protein [Stellaceae bacterium]|jgi:hypothetical protein|nr:DUF1150 family protein [Stellaceae bacterium]
MNTLEKLHEMSDQDFALIGMQQLAYIKPTVVNGVTGFSIHAADGTQIGMAPSRDIAFAAVKQHELEPVSLQ